MYNDSYYSRRGRTIERKKIDNGQVINPNLVPVYYNYLKDNGMFPRPPTPPAPPVHVDDGTCIAVDYSPFQSYSFPSSLTPLTDALGTLLFNLGIEVDINNVDHIILSFYGTGTGSFTDRNLFFGTSSYSIRVGGFLGSGSTHNPYTLTFVRDYSSSGTVFYLACTKSWKDSNLDDLVSPSTKLTDIRQGNGTVNISRIVVATLSETI